MSSSSPEAPLLDLSAEELLTTTRGVRKRLDFTRPVSPEVLENCVRLALQAPSGSNRWSMQFVLVTDPGRRAAIGEIYARAYELYRASSGYLGKVDKGDEDRNRQQQLTAGSADYLAANMGKAPALVLACIRGRADDDPAALNALLGSLHPGTWSFMLAARLHGLGTCWTTVGMMCESELAAALEIPLDRVTIGCLSPVAYTVGTSFRPAMRPEPDEVIHWDRW